VTRLRTDDIKYITGRLSEYDTELELKTGCSLRGLACNAAGIKENDIDNKLKNVMVGVIPITSGKGIICGFCEAVKSIITHIGCNAFITKTSDVAGLAEAFENNADIILLSDDERFVAIHALSNQVIDNAVATAKGYAAGLNLMADGLNEKKVLVIGGGPVGSSTTEALSISGAHVSVYDINSSRCYEISESIKQSLKKEIEIVKELDTALSSTHLIVDATPAANIINEHHIGSRTYICAPGVPIGLDFEAQSKISNRLLHDPLQIGVATMVARACKLHIQSL
jgi:pyrrolysine biosynthesis protein PylD